MFKHLVDSLPHYLYIAFYCALTKNVFLKIFKNLWPTLKKGFHLFAGGQHILQVFPTIFIHKSPVLYDQYSGGGWGF